MVAPRLYHADADRRNKKYYLYAKVSKTAKTGTFYISEQAIAMEGVAGYYHLLMGVLNSEYDGERSYVPLYGFTEVLPGQVVTNRIATGDGKSFIDFLNNALHLGNDTSYLDWNNIVSNTLSTINLILENATIKNKLSVLGEALIAGFYFSDEVIKSSKKSGNDPAMYLNGKDGGKIHLKIDDDGVVIIRSIQTHRRLILTPPLEQLKPAIKTG